MTVDVRHRAGWVPRDQAALEAWLLGHVQRVAGAGTRPLRPSVAALQHLVESDPVINILFQRMLEQRPRVHGRSEAVRGRGLGWDYVHVAVDDYSRLAYAEVCPVPGLMDTIKPRRIKHGGTTPVPGRAA